MTSYLVGHFIDYMDAVRGGQLTKARVADFTFPLDPHDEGGAAAVYCFSNDLEPEEWVPKLLKGWREERAKNPPPIYENIVLGTE